MRHSFLFAIIFTLISISITIRSYGEQRMALVIGNSAYSSIAQSDTAINDAKLVADTLEKLEFETTLITDANLGTLNRELNAFGRKLKNSDAVGLFYYAGHAVQVDGENFLLPVDTAIEDLSELSWQSVRLNDVLRVMKREQKSINIVVLDASGNNPFAAISRSSAGGLAVADAPQGTFIAYASSPGQVAINDSGKNSLFTRALAQAISIPDLTLENTFKKVRQDLLLSSNGKQVSWDASSLVGMFHFIPPKNDTVGELLAKLKEQEELIAALKQNSGRNENAELASGEECNRLATSPIDNLVTQGKNVNYAILRAHAAKAVSACELAINSFPKNDRYKYQIARAYLAMGDRQVESAHWMRKAAEGYYPAAMNGLGVLLNHGRGVAKDDEEAFKWVLRAAEKNYVPAMTNLAVAYQSATGVSSSSKQALIWFERAREFSNARAIINLAGFYSGAHNTMQNSLIAPDLVKSKAMIVENRLEDEFDAPSIMAHISSEWASNVLGNNVSESQKRAYWKEANLWLVKAIKQKDRNAITRGPDGYIQDIDQRLDAIIYAAKIPHVVDRPNVEKLYFYLAYLDNLFVVLDWNKVLLVNYANYGGKLDEKYFPKIDEARALLKNAKRRMEF